MVCVISILAELCPICLFFNTARIHKSFFLFEVSQKATLFMLCYLCVTIHHDAMFLCLLGQWMPVRRVAGCNSSFLLFHPIYWTTALDVLWFFMCKGVKPNLSSNGCYTQPFATPIYGIVNHNIMDHTLLNNLLFVDIGLAVANDTK